MQFNSAVQNEEFPGVFDIAPQEVLENKAELTVLDVREPDEFTGELGHIPGATLVPLGELEEKWPNLPKEKTIIFICRSGRRSAMASQFAHQNDFKEAYNMAGGMIHWNELKLITEK